jgi:L-rhamnose-H+ transport protein
VALGYCAAFGTLIPPIFNGEFYQILGTTSGRFILLGVCTCLLGIAFSGLAGMSKERELSEEEKKATVKEFNFTKGMLVATFSGIMSSCFAYGLAAGKPLAAATKTHLLATGHSDLWQNLPVLIVVLLGGFATNFIWCLFLHIKNRSGHEYFSPRVRDFSEISATEGIAPWDPSAVSSTSSSPENTKVPLLSNYLLATVAGITWYLQFFFYSMGQTKMGRYDFSSWTLHMASIIIFSTLWGIALHEWRGVSKRTRTLITIGLFVLVASTVIVGYGNYLKGQGG